MFTVLNKCINKVVEYMGMMLLVLMTIVVSWVVFSRYLLGNTPAWGEESALLCMVWFGFLSMALGVRDDLHISITMLDRIMPSWLLRSLNWFKRIIIFSFAVFMVIEGINMCEVALGNNMPGLGLNSAFLYVAVPIAGLVIAYYVIIETVQQFETVKGGGQ